MTVRRVLRVSLVTVLLAVGMALLGWSLVKARLVDMGIDQVSVSGVDLGWNRLAFGSVSLTWSGDGRSVSVESLNPRLTLDWFDWQLDRLVAGPTRLSHTGSVLADPASGAGSRTGNAFELTLPDALPFWLPRQLEVESLQASFPCQGIQCQFQGRLRFDREAESATATVDATLTRDTETLAIAGDVRLGSGTGSHSVTGGELQVRGIRPWLPQSLATEVRALVPASASVRLSPAGEPAPGVWPARIELRTQGGAQPAFEGDVVLHTGASWRFDITRGRLTASMDQWQQAGWLFDGLRARLPLSGTVTADRTQLSLQQDASLTVSHMDALESQQLMWLDDVALALGGTSIQFRDERFRVQGPLALSAAEVRYPGLVSQSWQAHARAQWQQEMTLEGDLTNAAGTTVPFRIDYRPAGALEATLSMKLTPDNEANHLAATLAAWPENLSLNGGRVETSAKVVVPRDGEIEASGEVVFGDASGDYRNMAWQTLSGVVQGHWRGGDVMVSTDALSLAQLNPGIPIGPINTALSYHATADAPGQGALMINNASAGFAGGTVSLTGDTRLELASEPWQLPVQVRGVQLSALMNLYPTEGLAGDGTLEGTLPVTVGSSGVRIDDGQIAALPPGGHLQLPADKLQGMAQGNQAMALVTKAMQNFNYRLLESGINYAEDGTLLLDLTLKGSSPDIDSDRPVVLNINLQEDIPALLTSLQLSGRVNEAVTERVRERLMQHDANTN